MLLSVVKLESAKVRRTYQSYYAIKMGRNIRCKKCSILSCTVCGMGEVFMDSLTFAENRSPGDGDVIDVIDDNDTDENDEDRARPWGDILRFTHSVPGDEATDEIKDEIINRLLMTGDREETIDFVTGATEDLGAVSVEDTYEECLNDPLSNNDFSRNDDYTELDRKRIGNVCNILCYIFIVYL